MISIARPLPSSDEEAAIHRVLTSGQLAQGENVAAFERHFAEACQEIDKIILHPLALHQKPHSQKKRDQLQFIGAYGTIMGFSDDARLPLAETAAKQIPSHPSFSKEQKITVQIPLLDLHAQYQSIKSEVMAAFEEVLESMQLFLGPQTKAFEHEFAAYCGCQHGVGLSNGTDALVLALRACGIGPGDEVITVANTFIATVEAIAQVGATPTFVDVDAETYTMDCRQLDQVLTARTRAIIPVHLYGQPVEMQPVMAFARTHGLWVIEDASQAHGATYQGQKVGSIGDIGCFSFYCSKNLGAYGEAGICVSNNAELAENIRLLRDHGSRIRYQHEVLGTNARIDELQAAVLRVKLKYLEQWNAARQAHAKSYTQQLQGIVETVPVTVSQSTHVYYVYVIQVLQRDQFRQSLQQEGIATGIHYPVPIHLQPACERYGYKHGSLPITEAVTQRIVSLPMYPEMTSEQIQAVINAVKKSVAVTAS